MNNILECVPSYKKDSHYISNIFDNKSNKAIGVLFSSDFEKIKFYSRMITAMPRFLNELYAYRMDLYSKTFLEAIKNGKYADLADKLATEKTKELDDIINYIITE